MQDQIKKLKIKLNTLRGQKSYAFVMQDYALAMFFSGEMSKVKNEIKRLEKQCNKITD